MLHRRPCTVPPMTRATAPATRHGRAAGGTALGPGWWAAVLFAAGAGAAVLALYLIHPIEAGYGFPIGPDGPVYTWLARATEATGVPEGPGAGPGVPALTVFLGSLVGAEPLAMVTILGPVLAAVCALTSSGLVESALGPAIGRALLAAVLTGAFAAYLAGGWLANLAMVATYLGALAALAVAGRSWRAVGLAGGLIVAAGLSHRVFLVIGVVILALVVAAMLPSAVASRREGIGWGDTMAVRIAVAIAGGAGLAGASLGWLALEPRIPGDTSQDGFFRRLDLRTLLMDRYRERLRGDAARAVVPLSSGVGLAALGALGSRDVARDRRGYGFLVAVWLAWAAVTAVGIVVLAVTTWGPPNRMLQFAFFVPVGGAVGAAALARRGGPSAAFALVAVPVFVTISMVGWFRQSPAFADDELGATRRAGAAVSALPPGTPLVFVVDTGEPAAAYHVTLAGNVLRMGVPAERIADVRLVVGRPADVLAGRESFTGDPEHDLLARAYLREAAPVLDEASVMVVEAFNRDGYPEAVRLGRQVADGVVLLTGPAPEAPVRGSPFPEGLGPLALAGGSVATVLILGLLGGGWARWGLPGAGRRAAVAVAPSAGIAVGVMGTVLSDRLGLGAHGLPTVSACVVLGATGYAAAWRARRGQSGGGVMGAQDRRLLHHERR
jgi:hypothetical protein